MNCQQAKAEIALWVGNDLDESAERTLRRHVAQCAGCRKHLRRMKVSMRVLQETGEDLSGAEEVSLWPRLSATLATAEERNARPSRFNGWVPAAAVAVACLVMVSLSNNTPPMDGSSDQRLPLPVPPVPPAPFPPSGPFRMSMGPPELFPPEVLPEKDSSLSQSSPFKDSRKAGDRHYRFLPRWETKTRLVRDEDR